MTFKSNPDFVIYTGPMFGGKTSRMLSALDRARYQCKKISVFKPKMDHRYAAEKIVTHSGHQWKARCVSTGQEVFELANDADIVAVDEAFMIDGIADVLVWLFKKGINVYVSSLSLSYNVTVFNEMSMLLPWATRVEVCTAVCTVCSSDAFYTYKKQDDGQVIAVGGDDMYEPRCWAHHLISKHDD